MRSLSYYLHTFPERNAIYVFLGAVRILLRVFQRWNTTGGTFQIELCLQVYVWLQLPMKVMLRNEAWSKCRVRVCKCQQVEWLGTPRNKSNYIKTNIVDLSKEHSVPYCVQPKGNSTWDSCFLSREAIWSLNPKEFPSCFKCRCR